MGELLMEDNKRNERSEEVQAIVDRMPTEWVKWVALCVGVLMGIVVLLGFLIQYPDTVDGPISVTANTAPVRLVANGNGRIYLLKANKTRVKKGDVISYLESGANYRHILKVEGLLSSLNKNMQAAIDLPDTLILGEVSSAYNAFMLAYMQYRRVLSSNIYGTMHRNLRQQITSDKSVIANINNEVVLKRQLLHVSAKSAQERQRVACSQSNQ